MKQLVLCPDCHRHVLSSESACPFCSGDLHSLARQSIVATIALTAGIALAGCAYGACPSGMCEGDTGRLIDSSAETETGADTGAPKDSASGSETGPDAGADSTLDAAD